MRTYLLLTLIVVGALACKKTEPVRPGLFGKWEIHRRYGSLLGFDSTYTAGNGTIYQFNSDSTYKYYIKYKLASTGTFHVRPLNAPGINLSLKLYFDNDTYGELFSYSGTTMTIGTAAGDGIASDYIKVGN
ncbi:hypothetical protein [Mucilaginibacter sp. BT774]|uniref:hypothetical protein n=1 Tax=Mucilaginibacter sp. BT774 TaxID=3062276 RepID=UPI0026753D69|nr:hypothetical protein [Mucilaginibacter sp. BT774]MDO3625563.1 hypothetical protein [Mucilaginibacter sp. BT774]